MPEKINEALLGVRLIKQQIDANKGIKKVEVLRVTAPDGFSEADEGFANVKVILQIEFNNGFKDVSGVVDVKREYYEKLGWGDEWKLGRDFTFSLPLVGMKAALTTAEKYYAAVLASNAGSMEKMVYGIHSKKLSKNAPSVKMIIQANGGIKNIEVKDVLKSASELDHSNGYGGFVKNYQPMPSIKINYDINYNNGKTEYKQGIFVLDNGQWKVLKIE